MSRRYIGIVMILIGVLAVAVSLLADTIGVGAQPGIIGWKQILGICIGIVVGLAGIVISRQK